MSMIPTQAEWAEARAAAMSSIPARVQAEGLPSVLLPYQAEAVRLLDSVGVEALFVEKSRRIGLTWGLGAYAVLRAARQKAHGGMDVMYISYSREMTREFIDVCAMWARAFDSAASAVEETLFDQGDDGKAINAFRIKFASGFEIMALSSSPRGMRGKQGVVIIDEAAFVDDLGALLKSAMAFLMWGGQVVVCSTHEGVDNPFNVEIQDILAGRSPYAHMRIDLDQALEQGLYKRIALVTGKDWTPAAEAAWRQKILDFYRDNADEELYCIPSASTPTWDWDGTNRIATLASTSIGTALALLGLTVGQMVHVGSIATLGGAVQNAFQNALANDMYGYARVRSISANAVVFDKVAARLQFDDLTAPATPVDLVFGEFIRNVPVGNADYLERSFQFEASFPNLGTAGAENYEYAIGNFCNEVSFELPLADKATASFNFIGTDTEPTTAVRKSGASAAALPLRTAALNTSADLARLRINRVDDTGLTTDFKSITLTLNNNVSPEKVLGKLGARFMNTGNFEVDVEAQVLFSEPAVTAAIRQNTTVTMDFILQNDDGAIAVDLPSITLGGGDREFPANESVLMNVNTQAFADPVLNTSIGVSLFPVPLRSGEIT